MSDLFIFPSERQMQVLELLGQGLQFKEIARRVHLSRETVWDHAAALRDYFDVNSNRAVVMRARRWGFIGPIGSPVGSGPLFVRRAS